MAGGTLGQGQGPLCPSHIMPPATLKPCSRSGCPVLVRGPLTACPAHQRGSSHARGYDGAWRALRSRHLAAHPLCSVCGRDVGMGGHVDHVRAFNGPDDPLRLDPTNLATMCQPCHSKKTCAVDGGWGH